MKFLTLALILSGLLLLAGCTDQHTHPAAGETEAGYDDHDDHSEKLTHFSDQTELFVEFPPLVVGEKSAFAAHLSRLEDFRAITAGKVSVRLSGGNQPEEVFAVDGPTQPGIFRPEATPKYAGERELSIALVTPEFKRVHPLGPITVYADRKAAVAAHAEHEDHEDGEIAFSKEQQWKVDFATAVVVTRAIRTAINATGSVRARPDGEALLSAPAAGLLKPVGTFPRLGQRVKKGELLASLLPRLGGESDIATLRAESSKAQVEHDLATQELARLEGLYRDEAVAQKRVLLARAAAVSTRAELSAARQRLNQYAGGEAGGVPLRAPLAGTIVDVHVSPGAFVEGGALLFHIADRSLLWLELRVPEADAVRLVNPSGAAFRVAGDDRSIEIGPATNGRLIAVGGVVDAVTRTLPVVFEFSPPEGQLPLGIAVRAQVFAGGVREAVAIPASSVIDEGGVAVVFVQAGGESFERVMVRLGARDGDWVEVLDGLTPGQRVVSTGAYLVKLAATQTGEIGHGHAH